MSLATQLANAAKQAQRVLAPLADPTGSGFFQISGLTNALDGSTDFTGVMNLRSYDLPLAGGGVERVEELTIVASAAQFSSAPTAAPRVAVTALGRSWWLTKVGPPGPTYSLTCVPQ